MAINEIAWQGTKAYSYNEWIELYNNTSNTIDISNWELLFSPANGTEQMIINLDPALATTTPTIDAFGYFLLERTTEWTVRDIESDYIYRGALNDDGGILELIDNNGDLVDKVDCSNGWFIENQNPSISMERIDSNGEGSDPNNWAGNNLIITNGIDAQENPINGTPGQENSTLNNLGSQENPFILTNIDEVQAVKSVNNVWYELGSDIDASETISWNQGKGFDPVNFTGHFDGKGFVIENLYINRADEYGIGLFSNVGEQNSGSITEIKDLGLINVDLTGKVVGGLTGYSQDAIISNCYTTGRVEGHQNTGGLIGELIGQQGQEDMKVENCYSIAEIYGNHGQTGGLVGRTLYGQISNSYSAGKVISKSPMYFGGFLGEDYRPTVCENNFFDALSSLQDKSACAKAKWSSAMKSEITFKNAGWDINNSISQDSAWVIEEDKSYPFFKNSSWKPDFSCPLTKGAGIADDPYKITSLDDLQNVNVEKDAWYEMENNIDASETISWNQGQGFDPIYLTGYFNGKGHTVDNLFINRPDQAGMGLFGNIEANAKVEKIGMQNFNITGEHSTGPLVGYLNGALFNSYAIGTATASVSGIQMIGGLVGHINNGFVENCYSATKVKGISYLGGFLGRTFSNVTINNCFWDIDVSGDMKAIGEEKHQGMNGIAPQARTTQQMKQRDTFVNWDFDTIWNIQGDYPFLIDQ